LVRAQKRLEGPGERRSPFVTSHVKGTNDILLQSCEIRVPQQRKSEPRFDRRERKKGWYKSPLMETQMFNVFVFLTME